jgi:exopolysaccharide production protein ExoQ
MTISTTLRPSLRANNAATLNRRAMPTSYASGGAQANSDQSRFGWEELALVVMLTICFGTLAGFVSKIQEIKTAPPWAMLLFFPPLLWGVVRFAMAPMLAIRTALIATPLLAFVLWACATMLWSNDPALTLRQGILLCVTFLISAMLAQTFSWAKLGRMMVMVIGVLAVASFLLAVGKPDWGVMKTIYPGAWSGIYSFKQTLGLMMALGMALGFGYMAMVPKAWIWVAPLIAVMAVNIVQSEATTAVVTMGLGLLCVAVIWLSSRNPSLAVLSIWGLVVGTIAVVLIVVYLAPILFAAVGKAPTLTGRTEIWAALEQPIAARGHLGWGYQAFWTDISMTSPVNAVEDRMDGFRPPDAHSTPLDIRLQLGIIGLGLAIVVVIKALIDGLRLAGRHVGALQALPFVVVYASICFTESIGLYPMDVITVFLQTIIIKMALTNSNLDDDARRAPQFS